MVNRQLSFRPQTLTYVLNVWLYLFQAPLLFGLEKFVEPDQAMSLKKDQLIKGGAHKYTQTCRLKAHTEGPMTAKWEGPAGPPHTMLTACSLVGLTLQWGPLEGQPLGSRQFQVAWTAG